MRLIVMALFVTLAHADIELKGPFEALTGDVCAVCNSRLDRGDLVFFVNGQRIGVMKDMEAEFRADPGKYAANLQPQGMAVAASGSATAMFLWAGAAALAGVLAGAWWMHRRVGGAAVRATLPPSACPSCGAPNHPNATRCLSCKSAVARSTP